MPGRRNSSNDSFRSILNAGDSRNLLGRKVELPREWQNRKGVDGVGIPTIRSKIKDEPSCDPFDPIICSICFGPVIQATSPTCGHIYCHDCICRAKQYGYKCPVCKENLNTLIRIYVIDEHMEQYKLSPELKKEIEKKRKQRISELVKQMELDKKSYSRKWKTFCEPIECCYEKYGLWGALRRFTNLVFCNCCSVWSGTCCRLKPVCNLSWIPCIMIGFLFGKYYEFIEFRPLLIWINAWIGELIEPEVPIGDLKIETAGNVYSSWFYEKYNEFFGFDV